MFLLSSSILFVVGIDIWFWLYKHKAFYATEDNHLNKLNRAVTGRLRPMYTNSH